MDAVFKLDGGLGDILIVYEDRIVIKHSGILNTLVGVTNGEKTIFYTDLTAIKFATPKLLSSGYIQFTIMGNSEANAVYSSGQENAIVIKKKNYTGEVQQIIDYIQEKIKVCKSNTQNSNNSNAADEILKYKKLMDEGIITPEEFEKKKIDLLNL